MDFTEYYERIVNGLLQEAEGDEPTVDTSEQPEGVEGVDVLDPEQESELGNDSEESEGSDLDTGRLIDLTNVLLNSLRFKPSDEFSAYLKMPKFHNLSASQKLVTIRNVLADHPEKIIKEEDESMEEFGKGELTGLTENEEMDLLRLIIRSINVNPYAMSLTLKELPSEADESNFEEIISTIENVLF